MQITQKEENTIKTYEIIFDRNKIINLINRIVKDASYKVDGDYNITSQEVKNNTVLDYLPNGDYRYINIKSIYRCNSIDPHATPNDYDSTKVKATQVVVPELAYILKDLLEDKKSSYTDLMFYLDSEEAKDIDTRISDLDKEIDTISNFTVGRKIIRLQELKELLDIKRNGYYFNTEQLILFYKEAISLINFKLVSETIDYSDDKVYSFKDIKKAIH